MATGMEGPWLVVMIAVSTVALIGNVTVLATSKRDSPGQVFSCGTAISSSLTSVFAVYYLCCIYGLIDDSDTRESLYLCLTRLCGAAFCVSATICTLFAASADRFMAIMFPFVYEVHATKKIAFRLLVVIYLYLAVFYAFPFLFAAHLLKKATCQYSQLLWDEYNTIMLLGNVGLPLVGCVILNVPVFRTAFRQRRSQFRNGNHPGERSRVWEEFGLSIRTSLTVLTFLGCWAPFTLYKFITLVTASPVVAVSQVVGVLPFFTCALNPILLGLKVSQLRTIADFTIFWIFGLCCCAPKESVDDVLLEGEREIETRKDEESLRVTPSLGFETRTAKVSALETTTPTSSVKRAHSCIILSPEMLESNNDNDANDVFSQSTTTCPGSSSSPKTGHKHSDLGKTAWN
ncbi:rhodopsin, GQ-coupled-like [Penaeus chinensis]|uniref:rhodopsin, GQ-coupled-like n=1 Tax=Penaeus chinensis TaxID=139456 RepID=UPI001FB7C8C0|nr:rhodopsin, GQ-coupled-like [Penaeus chinensis]